MSTQTALRRGVPLNRDWIAVAGMVGSVVLPFFNIPLILRIIKRKSSADMSLTWAFGIWGSILIMTPQALRSEDPAFRVFGFSNLLLFSVVVFFVVKYRKKS